MLSVAISQYPIGTFLTATADRGKEFACYANIESLHNLQVYFADPCSSWRCGSNENTNELLGEFFPNGTDLAQVADEALAHSLDLMIKTMNWLGLENRARIFHIELSHLVWLFVISNRCRTSYYNPSIFY
nr:IS30 family transposase [Paenibacillus sp. JJ-100]